MNTRWSVAIAVAILAATALPGGHAQGLLSNGHFGLADEGWVTGWEVNEAHRALYSFADDDGLGEVGALRYRAAEETPAGPVTQVFACRPRTDYVLMVAVKTDGSVNPVVRVVDPLDGRVIAGVQARGQQAWATLSAQWGSGDATELEVQVFGSSEIPITSVAQVGTAAVDDVQVYAVADMPEEVRPPMLFTPPGLNLALGKPYTYRPSAGYPHCRDDGDAVQLTDGAYTIGYFWTQQSTVGWMRTQTADITIDLEEDQPIAGVSFNTAAGMAGVGWPNALYVLVSDDGEAWYLVGDLRELSAAEIGEPAEGYQIHRFATSALRTHGRYVRLMAVYFPFVFCDEIEVYRGPDDLLAVAPPGERLDDPAAFVDEAAVLASIRHRLRTDLGDAREAIAEADLADAEQQERAAEADAIAAAIDAMPNAAPEDFATVLPLSDLHARIYALNAPVLRARGYEGLAAWAQDRYDPLAPTQAPDRPPPQLPSLRADMMSGEHRAEVFNLTNATDAPVTVRVSVHGLPGGDNPDYVSVREVLFTDTRDMSPIAAALPEAEAVEGGFAVHIPAGMTRQVWLALHPTDVEPGTHGGRIEVQAEGVDALSLPFALRVFPFTFPDEPTLALGGWDYMDTGGLYGVTADNMEPLIAALREHYVSVPWATRDTAPSGGEYDDEGRLTNELDFVRWDRWLERWPGARYYNVFLRAPNDFRGEPLGTPRFDRMVGEWITAWVEHMAGQDVEPGGLQLLVVDEPTRPEQAEVIVAYARAIKAAQPDVVIWEDTRYKEPWNEDPAVFALSDVLCPNAYVFLRADQRERDFYVAQQAVGADLWFYDCSGPGKGLDPYTYHRGQMWAAIRYGALGTGFWAFGSSGGTGATSWNAYAQRETEYSPLFIGEDAVTDGKHMEAIREGIEDYEYFVMLRARVEELRARGVGGDAVGRAEALLEDGPRQVIDATTEAGVGWGGEIDRSLMDRVRVQALEALVELSEL